MCFRDRKCGQAARDQRAPALFSFRSRSRWSLNKKLAVFPQHRYMRDEEMECILGTEISAELRYIVLSSDHRPDRGTCRAFSYDNAGKKHQIGPRDGVTPKLDFCHFFVPFRALFAKGKRRLLTIH